MNDLQLLWSGASMGPIILCLVLCAVSLHAVRRACRAYVAIDRLGETLPPGRRSLAVFVAMDRLRARMRAKAHGWAALAVLAGGAAAVLVITS